MSEPNQYETVIGLEVHAQLLTKTKLFCGDTTEFGREPNTQVSPISLGHPGTLPKMNKAAIDLALRLGLATNCTIVQQNYFARKNYFYPDLPKGYQISQHTTPICRNGFLEITSANGKKRIRINRIHIEEDAGKSLHSDGDYSNLDFNRAGVPLLEIVTEPDFRSADEAAAYVTALRKLVRHLKVCDGNMEQGSLRCDVNISVRRTGDDILGTRVEIKNLNSVRYIKKAIVCESERLVQQLITGREILQQTKGFDENTSATYVIRTKEDEDDYRYFPDPDLPPFFISDEWISRVKEDMPPLQQEIEKKLISTYHLTEYDAKLIAEDSDSVNYFFQLSQESGQPKAAANWIIGPVKKYCSENDLSIDQFPVQPGSMSRLLQLIHSGSVSYGIAVQKLFPQLIAEPATDLEAFISAKNLQLQDISETDKLIETALDKYREKITEYKNGKKGLLSLFVGEVMKLSKGKADAKWVTEKIIEKLKD